MKKLYSPIFPCEINKNKEISLELSVLDFKNKVEIIPFNVGWGIFDSKAWYWANDEEKKKIKQKANNFIEFDAANSKNFRNSENSWYSLNPMELEIEVTNACNQRCIHCGNDSSPNCNSFLDLEKIIEMIKEFKKGGGQRLLITGGEPLLYPKIEKILDFSKEEGIRKLEMVSNGSLIDKSKAKMLSHYLNYVSISIHGHDAKSHDSVTQLSGSFEKALKGIKLLKEEGVGILIYFTIMKENFDSVPKMFDLVKKLKCDGIRLNCLYSAGRAKEMEIVSTEGKKLLSGYIEQVSKDKNVKIVSSELYRKEYLGDIQNYKFYGCNALRSLIYFGADGTAYPCSLFTFPIGNIYTNSLSEIWRSPLANEIRTSLKCPQDKNSCINKYNCGGLCKAREN